ncbi:hypothetical protein WKW50_11755 [Ochrobactrum sp. GPK 3]|uniref:hypothetical protein n=1 Tax=Brucella sp. 22210 TaxID=3453892 RepID=UPI0031385A1B
MNTQNSLNIPLRASFGGWKAIPWIAWGHNNIGPRLTLHDDRIEFRLFRLRSRPYSSVSRVDYRTMRGTENIVLEFKNSLTTFIGNAADRTLARNAVQYLGEKGCPLSANASALLEDIATPKAS